MIDDLQAGGVKSERTLVKLLEQQINENDANLSRTGENRQRNHRNFSMQPLGNEIKGRSQYIEPKVLDAVQSKKAYFQAVFNSGKQCVKFVAGDDGDQDMADLKTGYVERQLVKNKWHRLCRDAWHDAFVAKRCVFYIHWEEDTNVQLLQIDGATPEELQMQQQQIEDLIDIDYSGLSQDPQTGLMYGEARATISDSKPVIDLVQPERYFRDAAADYPEDSAWITFEDSVTRGELINDGFDESVVKKLRHDYRFRREEEDTARRQHDQSWAKTRAFRRDPAQEEVTVYTTFTWIDLSDQIQGFPEGIRLWKIRWSSGVVLEYADDRGLAIEEASEMPFFEWSQIKIAHSDGGLCDADLEADGQKAASTMMRLGLDNQQARNMGKMEILENQVINMREAMNHTISGYVRVRQMGSVQPVAVQDLSSAFPLMMDALEKGSESRTGLSGLAKGMNKDAVSEQNSSDMIARLTNAANRRVMAECRDFASFLGEVFRYIYQLGVRHDKAAYVIEAAGERQQVTPAEWTEPAPDYSVRVALTPEETAQHIMGLQMAHQLMSQDPHLQQLYGVEQRHALADDFFDALGIQNADRYMMVPNSPEHQQQIELMNEAQAKQEQQAMQQMAIQQQLIQSADQREWQRVTNDGAKVMAEVANLATDNMREDAKAITARKQGDRKLDIEEKKVG